MILKHHPWVAKGEHYLSLRKEEKADILWAKITESSEMGKNWQNEITKIDVSSVFDEHGDEMDCTVLRAMWARSCRKTWVDTATQAPSKVAMQASSV